MAFSQKNAVCNGGGIPLNDIFKTRDPSKYFNSGETPSLIQSHLADITTTQQTCECRCAVCKETDQANDNSALLISFSNYAREVFRRLILGRLGNECDG